MSIESMGRLRSLLSALWRSPFPSSVRSCAASRSVAGRLRELRVAREELSRPSLSRCWHRRRLMRSVLRAGDVRHCVADVTQITTALGFRPRTALQEGMTRLVGWIKNQRPYDGAREADAALRDRGLVK